MEKEDIKNKANEYYKELVEYAILLQDNNMQKILYYAERFIKNAYIDASVYVLSTSNTSTNDSSAIQVN